MAIHGKRGSEWRKRSIVVVPAIVGLALLLYVVYLQNFSIGEPSPEDNDRFSNLKDRISKMVALMDLLLIEYGEAFRNQDFESKEYKASLDILGQITDLYKSIRQEIVSIDSESITAIDEKLNNLREQIYNKDHIDRVTETVDEITSMLSQLREQLS